MDTLIKELLAGILERLELPFSDISVAEEGDYTRVDIVSEKPSRLIGWHGETLNSIQHILKAMIRTQKGLKRSPFIVLDTDGYRREQEEKVKRIAEQKADFVRRTGSRVALSPMSPYFRRIVHLHIAGTEALADLTTESSGEGDYRQVILKLKDESAGPQSSDEGELSPVMADNDDGLGNLDI